MAKIILITGGSRSGKSAYAQRMAESISGDRIFIATCPVIDEEMEARIRKHREARRAANWQTVEETTDLASAIRGANGCSVILIDCLTLWVNNLMYDAGLQGGDVREEDIVERCRKILDACNQMSGTVIFVSNEVGMGVVPDNALARRYRDLSGRCNQVMADGADAVVFMVSGLPLSMKGEAKG